MSDRAITRRQALEATAAVFLAAGLSGCRGRRLDRARGPVPTLGWEVIAGGDDGPGPRSRHGLVYDRAANAALLFGGVVWAGGGRLQADTWELRGRQWTRIDTPEPPPARHRGA